MKNLDILKLFRESYKNVPAYKKFLDHKNFSTNKIKNLKDFSLVPISEKNTYIYKYKSTGLSPGNKMPAMMYASSGSSGKPTFWMRDDKQEEIGGKIHEYIFKNIFNIKKEESTLVVICFSMGIWIAGNYTLSSCRYLSRKGFNLTTATPGIEKEDIFSILKEIAPNFDNLILAGYPPFVMDIIIECDNRKIKIKNKNKFIITAGDKFDETWRDTAKNKLRLKSIFHIISIYGSADAAILGHETPYSISLRRAALQDKKLYKELFGDTTTLPAIVQYHPKYIYFENVGNEIVLTAPTAYPLIRYNIHDIGKILRPNQINRHDLLSVKKQFDLPFIIIKGRSDVAVTFYAINIYPENITAATEDNKISRFLTGNFMAYNKTLERGTRQKLFISLELAPKASNSLELKDTITRCIIDKLIKLNIEFRKLYSIINNRAIPEIILNKYHDEGFLKLHSKSIVNIRGKKPRMALI